MGIYVNNYTTIKVKIYYKLRNVKDTCRGKYTPKYNLFIHFTMQEPSLWLLTID